MDLSSASDQPSGVRRRLSSRKAAQLRSLFCSCTPTARLETESDDAVLMHRKISRSEGRIAAVHPPAPRRERKKSVIIIPLPAACIVSSSIIFLLLFPLFLASVSEALVSQRRESEMDLGEHGTRSPVTPQGQTLSKMEDRRPKLYLFDNWTYYMTFGKSRPLYDPELDVRTVPLIEGYKKGSEGFNNLQILAQKAGVGKGNLKKTINYAVQKARESPGTAVKVELEKLGRNIREVRAIAPRDGEGAIGNAILILWEPPETNTTFNRHHLGVVLVSGKPRGWEKMDKAKKQIAVEVSARNAVSLINEHNIYHPKKKGKQDESIRVFATHPIFGMPLETMKGYKKTLSNLLTAPVIDFLDEEQRFFPALEKQNKPTEMNGWYKKSVLGVEEL